MKYAKLILLCSLMFIATDFEVIITLEEPVINQTIQDAFRVNNLDYFSEFEGELVIINQTLNNKTIQISKIVKKYTNTKTSNLTFHNNSTQELCVIIQSVNDNNTENNKMCKIFFSKEIFEQINETPECHLELELMMPKVFEDTAILDYEITAQEYELTYWIEDLYKNIVKEKTTTKNDNKKQFTPKQAGVYFLFAELNSCNKKMEKNTFFIVKKSKNNFFTSQLKKQEPIRFEFTINSDEFIEKGIKIKYENTEIISDLLIGEQKFEIEIENSCGEQEIIIEAGDYSESYLISLNECYKEKNYESKINLLSEKNSIFLNIFNPYEKEVEYYLRKNNKKIGKSEFASQEQINKIYNADASGGIYEVVARIGDKIYTEKIDVEQYAENLEVNDFYEKNEQVNTPIITGASIAKNYPNETFSPTFIAILSLFIFLIGDKFKKYRRSLKSNEQKRNQSRSRKRQDSL